MNGIRLPAVRVVRGIPDALPHAQIRALATMPICPADLPRLFALRATASAVGFVLRSPRHAQLAVFTVITFYFALFSRLINSCDERSGHGSIVVPQQPRLIVRFIFDGTRIVLAVSSRKVRSLKHFAIRAAADVATRVRPVRRTVIVVVFRVAACRQLAAFKATGFFERGKRRITVLTAFLEIIPRNIRETRRNILRPVIARFIPLLYAVAADCGSRRARAGGILGGSVGYAFLIRIGAHGFFALPLRIRNAATRAILFSTGFRTVFFPRVAHAVSAKHMLAEGAGTGSLQYA